MIKNSVREIISTFNREGIPGNYISTFLFLWSFKKNEINIKQDELASMIGLEKRTFRGQLYKMAEKEMIESRQNFSRPNTITIKRFKHTE